MDAQELLFELGFTSYEAKVYMALARLRDASPAEVSRLSGVPRNRCYEILYGLESRGFLMAAPSKPARFRILSLEKLKDAVEEKKSHLDEVGSEAERIIKSLAMQDESGANPQKLWIIKGQKNIVQKIAFELKSIRHESLACVRNLQDYSTTLRNTRESFERGVKTRIICSVTGENSGKVRKLISAGADIRAYDEKKFGPFGTRFSVFDRKKCRITLGKPEIKNSEDYITVWSESPSLSALLAMQFDTMWKMAQPAEKKLKSMQKN